MEEMNYMNKSVFGKMYSRNRLEWEETNTEENRRLFQLNGDKGSKKEC